MLSIYIPQGGLKVLLAHALCTQYVVYVYAWIHKGFSWVYYTEVRCSGLFLPQAIQLKTQGNEALAQNKLDEAIQLYTEAIDLDPYNHILYSNRSAAYTKAEKYELALTDAEKTVELKPDWAKVVLNLIAMAKMDFASSN